MRCCTCAVSLSVSRALSKVFLLPLWSSVEYASDEAETAKGFVHSVCVCACMHVKVHVRPMTAKYKDNHLVPYHSMESYLAHGPVCLLKQQKKGNHSIFCHTLFFV